MLSKHYRLLDALPNPVVIMDNDMHITFINKAMLMLSGFSLKDCIGKHCSIFATPLWNIEKCCIKQYQRGESAIQYLPNGGANRISISVLYNKKNKPIGYIIVIFLNETKIIFLL